VLALDNPLADDVGLDDVALVATGAVDRRLAALAGLTAADKAKPDPRAVARLTRVPEGAGGAAAVRIATVSQALVLIVANNKAMATLGSDQAADLTRQIGDHEAKRWSALGDRSRLAPSITLTAVLRNKLDRAGATMADEWAIATGADGVRILDVFRTGRAKP
jgi:hypothetical protein